MKYFLTRPKQNQIRILKFTYLFQTHFCIGKYSFYGKEIYQFKSDETEDLYCEPIVANSPNPNFISHTRIFHLDASHLTAEELGIDSEGILKYHSDIAITIDSTDNVKYEKISKDLGLITPIDTIPWENGYSEDNILNNLQEFTINRKSSIGNNTSYYNTTIFPESKAGAYYVIEAGSNRRSMEYSTAWHFTENDTNCLIDIINFPSTSEYKFRLYPNSFFEGNKYKTQWQLKGNLLDPNLQNELFGADRLPNPSPLIAKDTWSVDINGQLNKEDQGRFSFDSRFPYACYNWEVFFHAPLMIADQLSKQQKFQEAERWLRYIFDPTTNEPSANHNSSLKFRVFQELDLNKQVIDDLTALAQAAGGFATNADTVSIDKLITRWRDAPFQPFLIARRRHIAFLWRTLFAYLDNLIAWADSLYRRGRETRESLNEATMLYVLAERILGRRPQQHQGKSKRKAYSYNEVAEEWDNFANYWIDIVTRDSSGDSEKPLQQSGFDEPVGNPQTKPPINDNKPQPNPNGMLYFCMPFNNKILTYWTIIDDRLSNLRHCRNIEGIERNLPLADAPIDPELLVRATAAGLDLSEVISGLYAPPPHYRYAVLSARATELVNEIKTLGTAMLSAIEKRDAEEIAQLRSSNEISMLKLVQEVRKLQITETKNNLEALETTRIITGTRFEHYQRMLGKKDIKIPKQNESASEESMLGNIDGLASERSSWGLIKEENEQYTGVDGVSTWSTAASIAKTTSSVSQISASVAAAISTDKLTGVSTILNYTAQGASAVGDAFSIVSDGWRNYAELQGMMAGHIRRRDEWAFQSNQALKELQQIDKQILANQIRFDITSKELDNHIEQIEQAQAVDEIMRSKFSNQQLYQWMISQLSGLYFNAYRMALDMARRAERAAARELGVKPLNILDNDHWDSLRNGLLAGERLHQDIKRLEIAYLDQNRREYELVRHVSLRRLNSEALVNLRIKNSEGRYRCEFEVPEWLFDLDTPGHYLRRIKSVSVSIPCVTGPYTNVSCKLTLLNSRVRHDRNAGAYQENNTGDDPRFSYYFGASEAIVTSTSIADSGMFETQLRDERFLPFESSGVISRWRLELPAEYPQFDYSTITDVILTVRYTARDGGDSLRDAATKAIDTLQSLTDKALRFPVLLSCRSDFPAEWTQASNTKTNLKILIDNDLLPYWMEAAKLKVLEVASMDLTKDSETSDFSEKHAPKNLGGSKYEVDLGAVNTEIIDRLVLLTVGKQQAGSIQANSIDV